MLAMSLVSAHKDFLRFFQVLDPAGNPSLYTPWQGNVVRQSTPRWMSRPYRFTGLGSALAGARWTVKGLMPTVYASTDPLTLNAEAYHKGLRYGWSPADFHSQLLVGMHWQLQAVLDLTAPDTLAALKLTTKELLRVDWQFEQAAGREPLSQALARAAFEHLAEGLVVPSARHKGGVNIAFFPTHRRPGTVIQTLDEAALPPDMHGLVP
jgi:RES domain-containing protein